MTTLRQAFCPHCSVVVPVEDGVLIRHDAVRFSPQLGLARRRCRGSGIAP